MDFIKKVWQLTILKVSPEALPYHPIYVWLGLGLSVLLSYLVVMFFPITDLKVPLTPLMIVEMKVINLFFLSFFLYFILKFAKKTNRFSKLLLAIIVGPLLIETVNFSVAMLSFLTTTFFDMSLLSHLMGYATVAWTIMLMGHIFQFGLEVSRFKGIWIGLGYLLISALFSMLVFGNPVKELL